MRIEAYERLFLGLTAAVLAVLLGAIFWSVTVQGITLPGPYGTIDPNQVQTTPPFDQPGLRQTGPGRYEVVMRAKVWAFDPAALEVPAGATVRFLIAPEDVVHGFKFLSLPVNVMLIPGQISVVEHTFDEPGSYTYVCHEYCGAGHFAMAGTLTVTAPSAAQPASGLLAGGTR
jgi:cytochrome c oxidase subunit 2